MAKYWTKEDEEYIKEWYGIDSNKFIGEVLDRTTISVQKKAARIGLVSSIGAKKTTSSYKKELLTTEYELLEEYINSATPILHRHIICGNEWSVRPNDITSKGRNCPKCSRGINNKNKKGLEQYIKELSEVNPSLICLETKYKNNKTPMLHKHTCGYEWEIAPQNIISQKQGCPRCSGVKRKTIEEYKKQLAKITEDIICLSNTYENNKTKLLHCHLSCGTEWLIRPNDVLMGIGCKVCSKKESAAEKELLQFIVDNYSGTIIENDRKILKGKEIDILLPELNIGIEFNGLYWHSENKGKDKNYHLNKTLLAAESNIQVIHIFENEWIEKQNIIKSRLLNILNKSKRIYARKCNIEEVNLIEAKAFLNNNHLQGTIGSSIKLGLYFEDELVSLMTIGKSRYSNKYEYELLRFCNKLNTTVVGGASKLFKHFISNYKPETVISYCDLRYGTGNLYENLGFTYTHTSKPNYWYFKSKFKLESRVKYQKHKLKDVLREFDPELTEYENMINNGFNRIWDCGNKVFVWQTTR